MSALRSIGLRMHCAMYSVGIALFIVAYTAYCGNITVNSSADNTTADNFITLREAIILSNQGAGGLGRALTPQEEALISGVYGAGIADLIKFAGSYTINLIDPLPPITDANTAIDGYTAPTSTVNTNSASSTTAGLNSILKVRVNGNGAIYDGIVIQANGCVVKGISLTSFLASGIIWSDAGNKTSGKLEGCYLGITQTGTIAPNGFGVTISNNNTNIKIGGTTPAARNLISGNITAGVYITGGDNCTIMGNLVGTTADGMNDLGNSEDGILMAGNSVNDTIGGRELDHRNVISGNDQNGINISYEGCDNTVIKNNFIGIGRDGKKNLKNTTRGILVDGGADNTLIGGDWDHNYICYNNVGIYLNGSTTTLTTISMNFIGFNYEGGIAGNIGDGIHIDQAITTAIGPKNRIGCNTEDGIQIIASDATIIKGNFIGTDSSAVSPNFGNGVNGIAITGAAANNVIGGSLITERNLIVFNYGYGIEISEGSATNSITNNYIGINNSGISKAANGSSGIAIINANGNTIGPNNVISGNDGCGVFIYEAGCKNNVIKGNRIGTNPAGDIAISNALDGVRIENFNEPDALTNTIGGNLPSDKNIISGNSMYGIRLVGTHVSMNYIKSNNIGLNQGGTAALKNDSSGIRIEKGANNNVIGSATLIGSGNVISGNNRDGITIHGAGTINNEIYGNIIGLNAAGTIYVPNANNGILLTSGAMQTTIGKNTAASRNVISGNIMNGIMVNVQSAATIYGNYIGTNLVGTGAIGNGGSGIVLQTPNNLIGSESSGYRNIICGNSVHGILIVGDGADNNKIFDNWIGQNISGNASGNGGDGIQLSDSVSSTMIGGTTGLRPNIIRGNGGRGVALKGTAGTKNLISGNSIYNNGGLGIDLDPLDAVNSNDNNDVDGGPNLRINVPTFLYGNWDAASKILTCKVRHNATITNQKYPIAVQFFTGGADGSGYGEGQTYLGEGTITAPNTTTTVDIPNILSKPAFVTAVAIDYDKNTSEFSANYSVTVPVELSLFIATIIEKKVQLSWKTETEQNNRGFEIERSDDSFNEFRDEQWMTIGFVDGAGTTTEPHHYSFIDKPILAKKYFYRLRQIDLDGTVSYSPVVMIDMSETKTFSLSQNFPNPFSLSRGSTSITFTLTTVQAFLPVTLKVYDTFGRAIKTLVDGYLPSGEHTVVMNRTGLQSGVYYYRLDIGSESEIKKMAVME